MSHRTLALLLALAVPAPLLAGDVSGRVFRDADGDGVSDPGEDGVVAAIEVFGAPDAGGSFDQNFVSAADGTLAAVALADGAYLVRVTPPPGFRLGPARSDCPGAGHGHPVGTRRYACGRHLIDALRAGSLAHLALGDSIAEPASICTLSLPDNNASDYVGRFGQRLRAVASGAAAVVTENQAIGGKRTTDLLLPAGTCGAPSLPHGGGDRCDNIFDAIARDPDLVSISIGGNDWLGSEPSDQTDPFDPAEVRTSIEALIDTRKNLQEILSTLASELPVADVIVNTVYDNRAGTCASSDFHDRWIPMWNQVLRDTTWAQGDRFQVAEVHPEYAHLDLNGQDCCGDQGRICADGIHPTPEGSRIHLEKVWEAAGGVNLGPKDPLTTRSNPDLVFPLVELVATRFPSQFEDLTRGVVNGALALSRDGVGAAIPAGDGEFVVRGFDAAAGGITPARVVVAVRYRTDSVPPAAPEGDAYAFEASVDGGFAAPQFTVTGWNTVVPIVGAGSNAPVVNARPSVPQWREVRALVTRNLLDDGRVRGGYEFPPLTWSEIASLAVRWRGMSAGNGPDGYRVELDAAWLEIYGSRIPGAFSVYRSASSAGLIAAGNLVATVPAAPYDDPALGALLYYAVDDGAGLPGVIQALKVAGGSRLTWN
jgi:lysophospholipase L1-like esterase